MYTKKTDIYALGDVIRCVIYTTVPFAKAEWTVPPPFDAIVEACEREMPEARPGLEELAAMVEAIDD